MWISIFGTEYCHGCMHVWYVCPINEDLQRVYCISPHMHASTHPWESCWYSIASGICSFREYSCRSRCFVKVHHRQHYLILCGIAFLYLYSVPISDWCLLHVVDRLHSGYTDTIEILCITLNYSYSEKLYFSKSNLYNLVTDDYCNILKAEPSFKENIAVTTIQLIPCYYSS